MQVFIVDDHQMIQLGMKTWIESNTEYRVAGVAGNIEDALLHIK